MRRVIVRTGSAFLTCAALFLAACGGDSTGPGRLDSNAALQSLAIGLQQFGPEGATGSLETNSSFGGVAPFLDQATVIIDGTSQTMFALGLRETFPPGTCEETLFGNIVPSDPTVCTPPQLGLAVLLWQAHSAAEPPDRLVLIAGDVGTVNFDFNASPDLPAVAIYAQGDSLWASVSGTLTSQVAATSQSCDLELPPYAKTATCSIATFDEQGSIVLEDFTNVGSTVTISPGSTIKTTTLTIPRQTLHGLWLSITELGPIPFTASRVLTPFDLRKAFILSR